MFKNITNQNCIHWLSLLTSILEKPMNSPAGVAKFAIMINSLTPFIVRRKSLQVKLKLDKSLEFPINKRMQIERQKKFLLSHFERVQKLNINNRYYPQ